MNGLIVAGYFLAAWVVIVNFIREEARDVRAR